MAFVGRKMSSVGGEEGLLLTQNVGFRNALLEVSGVGSISSENRS